MIELAVKTLDGKNRSFCVPDDITVKEFKEKIANSIDITADTQRLIYQGRVLQDEKKLSDYDVNGKTIHVVQRPPPSQRGPSSSASSSAETPPRTTGMSRDGNTFVLGSFTLPVDPSNVQNITQQVITGMGDLGRNANVSTRSSSDGSSVDVHIHLGQVVPPQPQSESQLRIDQARRMIQAAQRTLERLENPPSGPEEEGGSRGSSPMQTAPETPSTSSTASASASASTPPSGDTGGPNSSSTSRNSSRPHSPQHPVPTVLGDLLTEVVSLNQRLQPHLEAYQRLMADDPTFDNEDATRSAQRTFNLVSEALHYVSHAYHSISDLMIDMHRAPPRRLRAPPSLTMPHHMPMQAQVNVQTSVAGGPPGANPTTNPTANPTANPAASTTASSTATSTSTTPPSTANASAQTSNAGGPVHMTTTPLPGGGTANVASSNPYVFMELGPHALTINSISAHVVSTEDGGAPPPTAAAPTFTTPATNTNPFPRPGAPNPPAGTPNPPTGARPQGPPHAIHMQIPMMPGGMGPGGFGPPGAGMVPPEVMQNILQMVSQQGFPRPPGPQAAPGAARPSATSSASASNSSSTSATTSSAETPGSTTTSAPGSAPGAAPQPQRAPGTGPPPGGIHGMPPHAAFVIPGLMPGMGPGPLAVDPHLPCDSHHFMTERAQLQANNQNVGGEGTLGGMMSNLVSSLMGQQNPHMHLPGHPQNRGPQRTTPNRPANSTTGAAQSGPRPNVPPFSPFGNLFGAGGLRPGGPTPGAAANRPPTGPTPAPGTTVTEAPFFATLRQFMQEGMNTSPDDAATNQSTTQANPPQGNTTQGNGTESGAEPEFTDEMLTHLVRGISNSVAQAALGHPTGTLSNFLSTLGQNYNIAQSEGLLMDVFNVVAQNLTFTDIMTVFNGQPGPLQSLQGPLQDMVRDRVLQGGQPTDENIEAAVERLMTDITPEIEQACENAQARDDIDIRATLLAFTRHHLRVTIRFIMQSSSTDDQFGQHLYTLSQRVLHEFIVLGVHCLEGRQQALQQLIEQQMRHVSRGVNPMMQQWMVSIPARELTRMLDVVNIPVSDLEQHIRRTGPMESSPVPSEGSFMSAESTEFCDPMTEDVALAANGQQGEQEAMDIDSPSGSVTVGDSAPEAVSAASILEAQKKLPPPPTADPQDEVNVVIGSEQWHREVPQEWVPVISRDVRRQSREGQQPPLSDAYLNGMPAKRRKLGEKKSEQDLSNLNNIVPETLRRAVAAAGAESLTSLNDVTEEASASLPLHNAFEQQVCESVRERISNDPDFSAEKFPNANKFFKKGK